LRKQIVLISMLILWASSAHGAVSGEATGLDIMGSLANNTTIITPEGMPVEVDIVAALPITSRSAALPKRPTGRVAICAGTAAHAGRKNAIIPHGTTSRGLYATHGVLHSHQI